VLHGARDAQAEFNDEDEVEEQSLA